MTVYIALAIFPFFLGFLFPKLKEHKQQKICFYFLCGVAMLLVMGLRHYSLGSTDTFNYYNAMKRALNTQSWSSYYDPNSYEIGAQFFIFILSRVFDNPQWVLVITSLFYTISVFYFIDRNSDDIPLSITLYISLGLMTFHLQGLRQSMAMCICLFAYEQAKKKHLFRFAFLVLFAMAFHQTAIVFFPIYIICRMKYSKKNVFVMFILSAGVLFSADRVVGIANALFDREYSHAVESGGYVATLVYIITILVALVLNYKFKTENLQTPLLYVAILGFVAYILRYFGTLAAERISFYFAFSQLALLPNAKKIFVERDQNVILIIIAFFAVALFAYRLYGSDFVPYRFCWTSEIVF